MTPLYKRFHDQEERASDIQTLRELQIKLDEAVAKAYGWDDIVLDHDFHKVAYLPPGKISGLHISEAARFELSERLNLLNKERFEEEVAAGLHQKNQLVANAALKEKSSHKRPQPQALTNKRAPIRQVTEPAAQYDMLGEAEEPAPRHGNSWGAMRLIKSWPGWRHTQARNPSKRY